MKIGMIGLGKLGLPVALTIENAGHEVYGFDVNDKVYGYVRDRWVPYNEEGIPELLAKTELNLCKNVEEVVASSDIVFVAIQTPHKPLYEGITRLPDTRADFDYSFLKTGCRTISEAAMKLEKQTTLAVISTVLPGTMEREIKPLLNDYVRLVYNPSFIAMGTVRSDFESPEFVLLGCDNEDTVNKVSEFYASIHSRPVFRTTVRNAELIKLVYNTAISAKIAFVNTIMEVCHKIGADVDAVSDALAMATDRLISSKYLRGGLGDGGACLIAGTLVQTDSGAKSIETIRVGERVLAHDGKYRRVTKTFRREYDGDLVKIVPYGFANFPILATPDHPFWSARRISDSKSRFIKTINKYDGYNRKPMRLAPMIGHTGFAFNAVAELERGDVLALPRIWSEFVGGESVPTIDYQYRYEDKVQVVVTPDIMRLFGLYLAEGHVWKDEISFSLHRKENHLVEFITNILKTRFNLKTRIHSKDSSRGIVVRVKSSKLATYLEQTFGNLAWEKSVPMGWIDLPKEHLEELVRGMWYGDGAGTDTRYYYTTTSFELFNFNVLALLRFGIPFSTRVVEERVGKNDGVKHRRSYYVRVSDVERMRKLLPELFCSHLTRSRKSIWIEDDQMLYHIKDVERVPFSGHVYNLEVDGANSYCLMGAAVHNCHPRDNIALSWLARELDLSYDFFGEMMTAREKQTEWLADLIEGQHKATGLPVVLCGVAFKKDSNLVDGSPVRLLGNILRERGIAFSEFDPVVGLVIDERPALYFIGMNHTFWKTYRFAEGSVVIDPWGMIRSQDGVVLVSVGRGVDV